MKQIFFLGIGIGAQWIASPTFIPICGAADNPQLCIMIRGGIVVAVWLLLNIIAGGKK